MRVRGSSPLRSIKLFLALGIFSSTILIRPIEAEVLPAPKNLKVECTGDICKGRWDQVKGASFYQVWVKSFGQWTFNEQDLNRSPFTSSFEMLVDDEGALFKVRAVGFDGGFGEYSDAVEANFQRVPGKESEPVGDTSRVRSKDSDFDPKAPPPEAPTSLFTVWTEARTIKLVWRGADKAESYTVEELKGGTWVSIPTLTFAKANTALIKDHPAPGPYKFRVRSVGSNGRASKPSRTTTARR